MSGPEALVAQGCLLVSKSDGRLCLVGTGLGVVFPETCAYASGIPTWDFMGLDQEEFSEQWMALPSRLFSPFFFPLLLSSHSLLSPSPLQNSCLYVQRLWAGIRAAEARYGTEAAVSGTPAVWWANKRCPDQTKDQPLCEAGGDGADSGAWSGRPSRGEKCLGVGPKVPTAAVSLNAREDTSSYMTSQSHPSMDRLGGGGISFIKRVSVKDFLFLHPFPPVHGCLCFRGQ